MTVSVVFAARRPAGADLDHQREMVSHLLETALNCTAGHLRLLVREASFPQTGDWETSARATAPKPPATSRREAEGQ